MSQHEGPVRNGPERLQKALYRAIMESSTEHGIVLLDTHGIVLDWNEGIRCITGWDREEAVGKSAALLFTEEECRQGRPAREMRTALEKGAASDICWHCRKDGTKFWASGYMTPLHSSETAQHIGFLKILSDRTEEKRLEEQKNLLQEETQHRMANMFSLVLAIARQTFVKAAPEIVQKFFGRVVALAHSQDVLIQRSWQEGSLRKLVDTVLKPHGLDQGRFSISGDDIMISARRVTALTLALHELATNATKYGALSTGQGRVAIDWRTADGRFVLHWREHDGPVVGKLMKAGFGSMLIEQNLAVEFEGTVDVLRRPEGLEVILTAPLQPRDPAQAQPGI